RTPLRSRSRRIYTPPLPHRHPPTASVVLGRANGRARAVERRRRRPPAASTPGLPRERALGIDPLDRSGRDKRQRVPLEGDRMAIPIGFYIGARPELAVVHLPSFVGFQRPLGTVVGRLPSYDSTCSLSKLTFLLDSIIVNWTQSNYYLVSYYDTDDTKKTHLDEAPFGLADDDNGPGSEPPLHDHKRYVCLDVHYYEPPAASGGPRKAELSSLQGLLSIYLDDACGSSRDRWT
ncbi:hypothetical protein THAOC_27096, partial [Thalassiosira oceanica]